jgi:hypothetical protein
MNTMPNNQTPDTYISTNLPIILMGKEYEVAFTFKEDFIYAAIELEKPYNILEFVKTEFPDIADFLEDTLGKDTKFTFEKIDFASVKEKAVGNSRVAGSGFEIVLNYKKGKDNKKIHLQLTKAALTDTSATSKGKTADTKKTTSASIAVPVKMTFSTIPVVNVAIPKPFVVDIQRMSYVSGQQGRYYERQLNSERKVSSVKGFTLAEGFSFDGKIDIPFYEIIETARQQIETESNFSKKTEQETKQTPLEPETDIKETTNDDKEQPKFEFEYGIIWLNLKKDIGTFHLSRLGFFLKRDTFFTIIDASLTLAKLSIQFIGLKIGVSTNPEKAIRELPKVDIEGLAIKYNGGSVQVGGILMKTGDDFTGQVLLKFPSFSLIGTGIFGQSDNGSTSFFVYGFLDKPLGGPPFFFVKGLAAGFAYNRTCNVPLSAVKDFPLTKQALDLDFPKDLTAIRKTANDLSRYLPARDGSHLILLGVKFTSYEIVDSFALLVVHLADRVRVDVLGLSRVAIGDKKKPRVFVEIALKASFLLDEGILEVFGDITPNSYAFDKACKLRGGFAFKTWFKGNHKDDFVLTLGGYHPQFKKPSHYPSVPRFTFNWKISREIQAKGEGYFALTPQECMLGGRMEMVFQSGPAKAEFVMVADAYICWKPFHYDIRVGVSLCVSYRVKLKVLFTTIDETISLSASAKLHVWGPEFSGEGTVTFSLKFCGVGFDFSFDISFGSNASKTPPLLQWDEFDNAFLPNPEIQARSTNNDKEILSLSISEGLMGKKNDTWIVNRKAIAITVDSPIPVTDLKVGSGLLNDYKSQDYQRITVTPTGGKRLDAPLTIFIKKIEGGSNEKYFEIKKPYKKNVPSALWSKDVNIVIPLPLPFNFNIAPSRPSERITKDIITGFEIGYSLPPESGETSFIPIKNLKFSTYTNREHIEYQDEDEAFSFDELMSLADCGEGFSELNEDMVSFKEILSVEA